MDREYPPSRLDNFFGADSTKRMNVETPRWGVLQSDIVTNVLLSFSLWFLYDGIRSIQDRKEIWIIG